MLRAPLQHKHYENLDVFKDSVNDLEDILSSQSGLVDLQPLFFRLTLDITTKFLFGESVHSLKAPKFANEQRFSEAFNTAQAVVAKRFRLQDTYWMIGGSEFRRACSDVHEFADQLIDRNIFHGHEKANAFLDELAGSTADRVALRGQIVGLLVAGRDTTACLLTWTFFLLVRHPQVSGEAEGRDHEEISRPSYSNEDWSSRDGLPSKRPQGDSAAISICPYQ